MSQGVSAQQADDPVQRAKDICLRLLQFRPRTRAELQQALARKGIDADVADEVLSRLDEVGLIDDKAFAEMWVRSRHTYEGLGRRALAAELRRKGVDESVTSEAVATVDPDSEEARARQLVRKKLRVLPPTTDTATTIRRLAGLLARKGYPESLTFRIIRDELAISGRDTTPLDQTPLD
ncbi:regulatory protein RecX [Actinophytocola sp.]|uniref:regulatory protein RecX n=1 Tax=Actinophytocola sp. TaxID=1872138 RepID=UPI002D7ECB5B|nr:regulatory protein RecX [Actinophytocola sp.]HET9140113.1 regulatory protein RecX [Actinophytocola sp.]